MICSNCKRRLRSDATSCLCGKFGQESQSRQAHIQCCVDGCQNSANVRVWTKTGWANVCARVNANQVGVFHYETIEIVPRRTCTPFMEECREAYAKAMGRGVVIPGALKNILPREPGSDDDLALGITRDALEQEFLDRAQP